MIYNYLEYRKYIKDTVEQKKKVGMKMTYESLATSIRVQKSYLSKVLTGNAKLNRDQAYLLCESFKLSNEEKDFFFLLLDYDTSAISNRRKDLLKQIKEIQKVKCRPKEYIQSKSIISKNDTNLYYLDPLHQLVHMALTIKEFNKSPKALCDSLNISEEKFTSILSSLETMKIIEIDKNGIKVLIESVHLEDQSSLYWPWKSQLNNMANSRLQYKKCDEDISFSVVFTCDQETKEKIRNDFFKLLEKSQKLVNKSKSKNMCQLNFDLFKWL